jgi:hypothetical protein
MGFVVDTGEVLEIKMRVDLGRRNVRVPQELLHTAQIPTGFKQMRRKRVPEKVWIDAHAHALTPSPIRHPGLHCSPAQTLTATAHE